VIIAGILNNRAQVVVGLDAHAVRNFGKWTGSRYQDLLELGAERVPPGKKG
jgi:hypothetical protein